MCSRSRPRMQMTQPMEAVLESFTAFFRDNLISLLIPRQVNFLLGTTLPPYLQIFKLSLNLGREVASSNTTIKFVCTAIKQKKIGSYLTAAELFPLD